MYWPQYVILFFLVLSIGMALAKDGEPKSGDHSFWLTMVAAAFEAWVLYAGGFFGAAG